MTAPVYIWVVNVDHTRPTISRYTVVKKTPKQWRVKIRGGEQFIVSRPGLRIFESESDARQYVAGWFAGRIESRRSELARLEADAGAHNQGVEIREVPDACPLPPNLRFKEDQ